MLTLKNHPDKLHSRCGFAIKKGEDTFKNGADAHAKLKDGRKENVTQ